MIISSHAQLALGDKLIKSFPFSPLFFSQTQGLSSIIEKDKGTDPGRKGTEMSMPSQVVYSKKGMHQVQHFSCILHFSIKQKEKKWKEKGRNSLPLNNPKILQHFYYTSFCINSELF